MLKSYRNPLPLIVENLGLGYKYWNSSYSNKVKNVLKIIIKLSKKGWECSKNLGGECYYLVLLQYSSRWFQIFYILIIFFPWPNSMGLKVLRLTTCLDVMKSTKLHIPVFYHFSVFVKIR